MVVSDYTSQNSVQTFVDLKINPKKLCSILTLTQMILGSIMVTFGLIFEPYDNYNEILGIFYDVIMTR